ncbi:MAG: hypothetical protein SCALA702_34220 [Melioribacteraceae bacterium]|nr:MAG: hypothetical protein SCALA702_34220 [Melioribacteraceae bacterium]
MFRKKGIIGILVFTGILLLGMYFFTDDWLESTIEDTAQSLNGAKVEIDNLDFSIIGLHIKWDRLQVANPRDTRFNRWETGKTEFNLEFYPLLSGKIILENLEVSDIKTNSKRDSDGKIEKFEEPASEEEFVSQTISFAENKANDTPGFNPNSFKNKLNVDSLLALLEIKTPGKIDSLYKVYDSRLGDWQKKLDYKTYEADLKRVETNIKSININNIKDPVTLKSTYEKLTDTKATLEKFDTLVSSTISDFNTDISSITDNVSSVDDWIKEDYNRALSKAKLPDLSVENIGMLLFGASVVDQYKTYLGYVQQARYYKDKFSSDEPEKESPPRFEGQDIPFPDYNARPEFWLKQIKLSGETENSLKLSGLVTDIVSNQKIINKTTNFNIESLSGGNRNLKLSGVFNYLSDIPQEQINLTFTGFTLNNFKLSDAKLLPEKIESGNGAFAAAFSLSGERINSNMSFSASAVKFSKLKNTENDEVSRIIDRVLSKVNTLTILASLNGEKSDLKFSVKSNLDNVFADALKETLNEELAAAKQKIEKYLESKIEPEKAKIEKLVNEQTAKVKAEADKIKNEYEKVMKQYEAKKQEFEKKKKQIENDLGGGVLNLFK